MGAQWKHAGRIQNASKRGAFISKLVREITVASKIGGPHPESNSRLRAALEVARKASVPRETIDRAVSKGAGLLGGQLNYELMTYEGFAPHQVAVIVECFTENKNRTAADIRLLFRKGQLGSRGTVNWMFDHLGVVEAVHADQQDIEVAAIEAGAQSVQALEASECEESCVGGRFLCAISDLDVVSKALIRLDWVVKVCEISYLAKNPVSVSSDQAKEVIEFLDALDDHDDVHRVYTSFRV